MLLTDLNGPMSLQPRSPGLGRISRLIRFAPPAIVFLCCATFGATVSRAKNQQDQKVAEAARQERARKQELRKRAKHVYTEEDLKHPSILTPEDRAEIEAKRNECAQKNNCSRAPTQNPPASLDANSETPQIPLGDVARQLRKQKELQALKPKQSQAFHLPFSTPALASPILAGRPAVRLPAQPVLRPKAPSNVFRRDPFSAVPVRPELRRTEPKVHPDFRKDFRPTLRAHGRPPALALPRISSLAAPPSIPVQPMHPFPSTLAQPNIFDKPVAPSALRPSKVQPARSPAMAATRKTVRIQAGDSLWKLAQQSLGRGSRWPELVAVNPRIADPNKISVGAELNLPAAAATAPRHATNSAASTIKVRKGDTLWSLAKSQLSRASAWPCLAAANPSIANPNRIYENQEFTVPLKCKP